MFWTLPCIWMYCSFGSGIIIHIDSMIDRSTWVCPSTVVSGFGSTPSAGWRVPGAACMGPHRVQYFRKLRGLCPEVTSRWRKLLKRSRPISGVLELFMICNIKSKHDTMVTIYSFVRDLNIDVNVSLILIFRLQQHYLTNHKCATKY